MKKALLLFSSIAIFSMAACTKSSENIDKSADSADLYKLRITRKETNDFYSPYYYNNTGYNISGRAVGRLSYTTYEEREYDSHNSIASEVLMTENKLVKNDSPEYIYIPTYYDYADGAHGYINSAFVTPSYVTTSYTNRYDENGNLIYRLGVYRIDNGRLKYANDEFINAAYSMESEIFYKRYLMVFVEEYKYDNQNRLINKTYNVVYTTDHLKSYVSDRLNENWTFSSFTENYTYQGDSREYKTYKLNGIAYREEEYVNAYAIVTEYDVSLMNIRQFNDYGDIISEVETMSASEREVDDPEELAYCQNGYNYNVISYSEGYAENYTLSTTNTYDEHHCLVESTTSKTTNQLYLDSYGDVDYSYKIEAITDQTMSYYKNNPKKPTSCLTVTTQKRSRDDDSGFNINARAGIMVYTTARTYSYDNLGRLKFESVIDNYSPRYDGDIYNYYDGDIYNYNSNINAFAYNATEVSTKTVSMFIY